MTVSLYSRVYFGLPLSRLRLPSIVRSEGLVPESLDFLSPVLGLDGLGGREQG